LILYRAAWVLPIAAPPIRRGWVLVDRGLIRASGSPDRQPAQLDPSTQHIETIDLGNVAVLPGLVNAHTHLELSWMRNQVPPSDSMPAWAARLMALRRTVSAEPPEPIREAVRELRAAGTALVGEVTNTLAACGPLADSEFSAAVFRELLGFNAADPEQMVAAVESQLAALPPNDRLRPSIVPHAPYSVSPSLLQAIRRVTVDRPLSIHLGESPDELQFLRDGTGAWRDLLQRLGVWNDTWEPPGCSPVEYLDRVGLVNERLLAVHGTHFNDGELARLAAARATVVTCPRSNAWTGAGTPPVERFYASGVRVAIGTDSLASVDDLNLFAEMAAVHRLAPGVSANRILASATRDGAVALGFGDEYGTMEPGKRADLIAVPVPPGIEDVEQYLVSGIEPQAIRWLGEPGRTW
jgi:cytosine/adenosine deaminase-related metal-dependent hydrolase